MNKKSIFIPLTIFLGVLLVGSLSNAYALLEQPASDASFGISQETEYYLKGSFNSWTQENAYRFVNNTPSMEAEANKIREYKLENISLAKDAELKIWANNDVWFKDGANNCSYSHHWSNAESFTDNDDHNYIVPMTSNTYSFYLKFYSNGSSQIYITANKDVFYFIPSSNWKGDNAKFAIEMFNNSDQSQQIITESVESPSGTFKFEIGNTYPKYKILRRDSTNENTWNYSNIQTISNDDTNNCFALWDEYWGGGNVWSGWNAAGGETSGVSCGTWSTK